MYIVYWDGLGYLHFFSEQNHKFLTITFDCLIQINTWSMYQNIDMNLFELRGSIFSSKNCLKIDSTHFTQSSPITLSAYYIKKACFGSVFRPEICQRFPYKVQQQILLSHFNSKIPFQLQALKRKGLLLLWSTQGLLLLLYRLQLQKVLS